MNKSYKTIITAAAIAGLYMGALAAKSYGAEAGTAAPAGEKAKDSCKGKDGCKGKDAKDSCKGHNDCKTAANACKGHGECKGQGFVALPASTCSNIGGSVG